VQTAKHREAQTQAQLNTLASQRPVQVDPAEGANDTGRAARRGLPCNLQGFSREAPIEHQMICRAAHRARFQDPTAIMHTAAACVRVGLNAHTLRCHDAAVRVAELQNRIAEEQVRVAELEAAVGRAKQESEEAAQHVHQVAEAPKVRRQTPGTNPESGGMWLVLQPAPTATGTGLSPCTL
jgi:hypothetical protein